MLWKKIVLKIKKINWRVNIKTNTLYNQHFHIGAFKLLHVVTYKWKYINIVNSSTSILSQLKEMKSCKNSVEFANAGMRL